MGGPGEEALGVGKGAFCLQRLEGSGIRGEAS